jgi:hypothetical protein
MRRQCRISTVIQHALDTASERGLAVAMLLQINKTKAAIKKTTTARSLVFRIPSDTLALFSVLRPRQLRRCADATDGGAAGGLTGAVMRVDDVASLFLDRWPMRDCC